MRRSRVLMFIVGGAAVAAACGGGGGGEGTPDGSDSGTTEDGSSSGSLDGVAPGDDGSSSGDSAAGDAGDGGPIGDAIADADADAPFVLTYKHYDINHVLSTGASDSVANGASAFVTTTQPFGNLSFDTGVMTAGTCNGNGCTVYQTPSSFIPLVEGDKFFNYGVETISSGLANQATASAAAFFTKVGVVKPQHDVLVSLHGRSGNPYWCLRWQTANVQPGYGPCYFPLGSGFIAPFEEGMMQVQSAMTIAAGLGKTYVVRGVTAIAGQGESDSNEQNFDFLVSTDGANRRLLNYTDGLLDWQWDYEHRVKMITGQTEPVPLFISQFGSMTTPESIIPQRQLDAHTTSNGKVVLVTPNYPFQHYTDCLHYNAHSQRRLGAYFAKAYTKVVIEGGKWEPTRPKTITRAGNVITVKYVVPVPPLVIDTVRVTAQDPTKFPVAPYYGFIYRDDTMSASITNVQVTAPDTVTITLSATPTGADKVLRYAYESQNVDRCPGPTNGARGNIRDSDTTKGYHTDAAGDPYELFNWSVAFQMPVP